MTFLGRSFISRLMWRKHTCLVIKTYLSHSCHFPLVAIFVSVQLLKGNLSLYKPGQGSKRLRLPEIVDSRNVKEISLAESTPVPEYVQLVTYLLTPWSRVLLEKLTGSAASQEIPRIFGTRRFLTVLASARHLSLS